MTALLTAMILAVLPVFLLGGLAVEVRTELGFGEAALGLGITGYFAAAGLVAPWGGRMADRLGGRRAILVGSSLTAVASLIAAAGAHRWLHVFLFMTVAGVARTLTEPGLALLITDRVPSSRRALAFGIKESAIPGSALIAGLALPLVALTLGWRWAFGFSPILLLVVHALLRTRSSEPSRKQTPRSGGHRTSPTRSMRVLAISAAVGIAPATALGTFLVEFTVATGLTPALAGALLAVGSAAGILFRPIMGWLADRSQREQFSVIAVLLAIGSASLLLLAVQPPLIGLIVGTVGGFTAGWGWAGLLFFSVVRARPQAPAAAAGTVLAGLSVGGALGPLTFGVLVSGRGYTAAWLSASLAMLFGAVLMLVARTLLRAPADH